GERGGEPIDGFDMGNSPNEYVESKVRGRKIVFTTTNGTKAMQLCRRARRVLVGSVVNLSAIVRELREVPRIDLLCAGTHGEVSREDVLAAGWMTHLLLEHDAELALDDQALIAQATFRDANLTLPSASDDDRERCVDKICEALLDSHGGKNLIRLNRQGDVRIAADVDSHDLIPELDSGTGTIQAVSGRKSTSDGGD
ncbi:MAG: 2-phosphosulfolactate phosphatase, partial [Planctomycetales bacterium]